MLNRMPFRLIKARTVTINRYADVGDFVDGVYVKEPPQVQLLKQLFTRT